MLLNIHIIFYYLLIFLLTIAYWLLAKNLRKKKHCEDVKET